MGKAGLFAAFVLLTSASACKAQDPYDRPAKQSSEQLAQTIRQLKSAGHINDAFRYWGWAMKDIQIGLYQMHDPTPDITPRTVREAIAEEVERDRREERVGVVNSLKTWCRMKNEGKEDLLDFVYGDKKKSYELNGKSYDDPCDALKMNGIPLN